MRHGELERHVIDSADHRTWKHIIHCQPGHTFVYRLLDSQDRLLYVGITWSAQRRWEKHKKDKPWWLEVRTVEVECFDGDREALAAELEAIRSESPKHNKRGAVAV